MRKIIKILAFLFGFLIPIRWPYVGGAPDSAVIFSDFVFPFFAIFSIFSKNHKEGKIQIQSLDVAVVLFILYTVVNGGFNPNTGSPSAAIRQIYLLGIFIFFRFFSDKEEIFLTLKGLVLGTSLSCFLS